MGKMSKTVQDTVEEMLLKGLRITKFDLLNVTNSVCLAQRILDIKQTKGWHIRGGNRKGKGNLKEYWLDPEEIERITGKPHKKEQIGLFSDIWVTSN